MIHIALAQYDAHIMFDKNMVIMKQKVVVEIAYPRNNIQIVIQLELMKTEAGLPGHGIWILISNR